MITFSKKSLIDVFFYLIILLLTVGIYSGHTLYWHCLLFIILRLLTTNLESSGFFLILFGGLLGGATRIVYPFLPIYGIFVILFGIILLWKHIIPFFTNNIKGIIYLCFIFLIFFIAYLYGPQNIYSDRKILEIVYKGSLILFAYYVFNNSSNISNTTISQTLILTIVAYFVIGIHELGFSRPSSFFDYEWYRYNSVIFRSQDIAGISYQSLGMNGLYALSFLLSQSNLLTKKKNILRIILSGLCIHLILSSGARQAIFGLFAIYTLYLVYFVEASNNLKRKFLILFGIIVIIFSINLISGLNISFISKTLNPDNGDYINATGRSSIYFTAFSIIQDYPLFGVGLGGFSEFGGDLYPHNIFLEIMTETGLWGLLSVFILIIIYIKTSKLSFKHKTANNSFVFIVLACIFIRALFSSDLTESIGLISGIMALNCNMNYKKQINNTTNAHKSLPQEYITN